MLPVGGSARRRASRQAEPDLEPLDLPTPQPYNLSYSTHISRPAASCLASRKLNVTAMLQCERTTMRLRKLTSYRLTFGIFIAFCSFEHCLPVSAVEPGETEVAESLYTPTEAETRAEYQRDRSNQKLQTWKEYWGWVQGFYRGNLLADGWTKYSQSTLAVVKAKDARPEILKKLNRLGKLISREWAKHDSVRKITTTDLRRWHDAITEARRNDDGTGQGIQSALDKINDQAEKQLAG
jgi:hypothetical protein